MLRETGNDDLADILQKCEQPLALVCICCGGRKVVETRCKKRWCPVCARKLAAEKVARYKGVIDHMISPLFVTLTERSSENAFAAIRGLRKSFSRFRRTRWWNSLEIAGGVIGMEITWTKNGFHPHIHALVDCPWLAIETRKPQPGMRKEEVKLLCQQAQRELSMAWAKCLDQEQAIVWVGRAKEGTEREVLKYSVKPAELIKMGEKAGEIIRAMIGVRLVSGFGSCYGKVKEWSEEDKERPHNPELDCCQHPQLLPEAAIATGKGIWKPPPKRTTIHITRAQADKEEKWARQHNIERLKWKAAMGRD